METVWVVGQGCDALAIGLAEFATNCQGFSVSNSLYLEVCTANSVTSISNHGKLCAVNKLNSMLHIPQVSLTSIKIIIYKLFNFIGPACTGCHLLSGSNLGFL
jgi:hypothetical protein